MTTPEPVSPAPKLRVRSDWKFVAVLTPSGWVLWRTDSPRVQAVKVGEAEVADWLPLVPAVSPAPDTEALRQQVGRILNDLADREHAVLCDCDLYPSGCRMANPHTRVRLLATPDYVRIRERLAATIAEREAGLRADLDRARRDVDRLTAAAHTHRENWMRVGRERDVLWDRATTAERQLERLRAESAGVRPIPDDAAVVARVKRLVNEALDLLPIPMLGTNEEMIAALARIHEALSGATPTTGPAPAAADEPRVWRDRDGQMWGEILDEPFVRLLNQDGTVPRHWNAEKLSRTERVWGPLTLEPAAPQAPAEPKKQCAWWGDTKQCPDWASAGFDLCGTHQREHDRLNEPFAPSVQASAEPTEPMASCGYHTEAKAQRSIRHELCTPAAREDAATQPLPLYEQADLLTWRVVHVPPGTTDREDTDTPITPGWWLVGHGDDPDHPDVQVHLGDRLPTSSAATPGDEYNDDLGGWVRPTPIQPEEA